VLLEFWAATIPPSEYRRLPNWDIKDVWDVLRQAPRDDEQQTSPCLQNRYDGNDGERLARGDDEGRSREPVACAGVEQSRDCGRLVSTRATGFRREAEGQGRANADYLLTVW
jgi:hypothetical protein